MSVTKHHIGEDTDPPEKVAFPVRGGTVGLEMDPGKYLAVLSNKTVSSVSRKCACNCLSALTS